MATYAIGDVQGCFTSLQQLLGKIQFNENRDTLWFTGDLVNRGPRSLEVLRFIKQLGQRHITVLGNHDLHLLAVAENKSFLGKEDTLSEILQADDCRELLNWLRHQPLLHYEENYLMVHAGLAAEWDLKTAKALAREVENILRGEKYPEFLSRLYGNYPHHWSDDLTGWDRIRCIVNYFTRARFCYADGGMEFNMKGTLEHLQNELIPWFSLPQRKTKDLKIIFGHWAALQGVTHVPNTYALDTGCVWGHCLTAMRLEDEKRFSVAC